jgi:hypothetical protein
MYLQDIGPEYMNWIHLIRRGRGSLNTLVNLQGSINDEEIIYFPFIRHRPQIKRRPQKFFVAAEMSLPSCYLATVGGYRERQTDFPLIRHGPQRKLRLQQFFYCCVFLLPRERVYRAVA